jgi:hypothetical protein
MEDMEVTGLDKALIINVRRREIQTGRRETGPTLLVMVQEDRVAEKEDQVEEKEDQAVEKEDLAVEDPVQDREIMLEIIYINRRRLETPESGQGYKITGQETCIRVASPGKMPAIPSPQQVTGNLVLVQAIIPGRVPTRE